VNIAAAGAAVPITDNSGSITVDTGGTFAVQAAQSGSWTVQPGNTANTTAWLVTGTGGSFPVTDSGGSITVDNAGTFAVQASQSGTWNIGTVTPGTGATNLGKAEDAAHTSGDVGVMALAVRQNSQSDFGADGDYVPLSVDDNGGVRVSIVAGAGSGGTASADDADFTAGTTQGTPAMGVYESTPTSVTDGDLGIVGITANRELKVNVSSGGVSGRAEDSAHTTGHEGVVFLAVRRDSASSGVDADGDYATLSVTSDGSLRVSGGTSGTEATHDSAAQASGPQIMGVGSATAPSAVSANGDAVRLWATTSGALNIADAGGSLTVDGTVTANLAAGTNNIGDVDVLSLPSIPAGTNNIGDVDIASIAAGDNNIGNVDIVTMPNVTLAAGTNTNEVVGDVAHDAAAAGNPVLIAGRATNNIEGLTQVAAADASYITTDLNGCVVVRPYTTLEEVIQERVADTGGTSTNFTNFAAGGAGIRNFVTSVTIWNSAATDGFVDLRDGSAGSVIATIPAPQTGGAHVTFPVPLRTSANTALAYDVSGAISTVYITVVGFQARG
jgi:hypothetical protein